MMKKIMNITTNQDDTRRFSDNSDLKNFYGSFHLDGLEVMQAGVDKKRIIHADDTIGVHLNYITSWMDFWKEDKQRLFLEYGNLETVRRIFGGTTKNSLINLYRKNLAFAASLSPEYLVFHVSDCTIGESMKRQYHYSDEEVIDASAELINSITGFIQGSPLLLFENLWYPGLTMLSPKMTKRLLSQINYQNKGVMLDVGHLLHTNTGLLSLDEGVSYILSVLAEYKDISFIKGLHLHQTLNGSYAKMLMQQWQPEEGSYKERYWGLMQHIYKIDSHQPFMSSRVNEIIEAVSPEYLVFEQVSINREEHEKQLREQMKFF